MNTPTHSNPVLAWDGTQWLRAQWVAKQSMEVSGEEDYTGEYNDADDTFYFEEGWYEVSNHGYGQDETYWYINEVVTAWQELPPAPGETR